MLHIVQRYLVMVVHQREQYARVMSACAVTILSVHTWCTEVMRDDLV